MLAFVAIPGAVYLLFLILRPAAFGKFSMLGMLITQSFINSIIAWGLSFSMTAGNLDLSIGAQISVSTIVAKDRNAGVNLGMCRNFLGGWSD